jgi:hypothetical protein
MWTFIIILFIVVGIVHKKLERDNEKWYEDMRKESEELSLKLKQHQNNEHN